MSEGRIRLAFHERAVRDEMTNDSVRMMTMMAHKVEADLQMEFQFQEAG